MNPLESIPERMRSDLVEASKIVRRHEDALIVSHYDADGVSSAIIMNRALDRMGIRCRHLFFPVLSDREMEQIGRRDDELIVMTDMGASYLESLSDKCRDMVILDHHRSPEMDSIPSRDGFCFVNPHLYGIDGSRNSCASTVSYLFALTSDMLNRDLSVLALSGMIGDKQNLYGSDNINRAIIDDAIANGHLEAMPECAYAMTVGIGPLIECTSEPFLKGITGNSREIGRFLRSIGIEYDARLCNLSSDELKRFNDAVAAHLRSNGVSEDIVSSVMCERFISPGLSMDIGYLSMLFDGCGRTDCADAALFAIQGLCFREAEHISRDYYRRTVDSIDEAFSGLKQMENIQYIVVSKPSITGILCSTVMRYLGDQDKPTIGIGMGNEERVTFSSRGTSRLVSKGLNLAVAMRESGEIAGGEGGGHNIAAGGNCPHGMEMMFLESIDRIVGEQLRGA